MEKNNARERTIDYMKDTLEQGLQKEAFSAANNSTKLT
jgi:hypothetical protein